MDNAATTTDNAHPAAGGSDWAGEMSKARREALYLRGGYCCCYCGHSRNDGAKLALDHVVAQSTGGGNSNDNLIVACDSCNSSKGAAGLRLWLRAGGASTRPLNGGLEAIYSRARRQSARPLDDYMDEATRTVRARDRAQRAARKARKAA